MTKLSTDRLSKVFGSSVRAAVFRALSALPPGHFASAKFLWLSVQKQKGFARTSRSQVSAELNNLLDMDLAELHKDSHAYAERLWQMRSGDALAKALAAVATSKAPGDAPTETVGSGSRSSLPAG